MAPVKRSAGGDDPRSPARKSVTDRSAMDSPLKRVKTAIQQRRAVRLAREELVLSSVDEFRQHVENNEKTQPANPDIDFIVIATLIWKSTHTYGDRAFVRLHLTDAAPDETFEELREFEDLYSSGIENQAIVDGALLTVTVFGETAESPNMPRDGSVVRIANSRRRLVYEETRCQLIARAADITVINEAS